MRRFVYTIEPVSLIPEDAEYIFESEEELKPGDVFERAGRRLTVERVEDDHTHRETETDAISRTLHCRLEVDPDASWPGGQAQPFPDPRAGNAIFGDGLRDAPPSALLVDEACVVVYCPPCAAAEFGYRPDIAARYVCAWQPLPGEVVDSQLPLGHAVAAAWVS